ncbi:MAG: transporter [Chitinophagales bacterium]|nr:transporter [Chitinophagales bacterium]
MKIEQLKFLSLLFFVLISADSYACDFCGCNGSLTAQQGMNFGNLVGIHTAWESYALKFPEENFGNTSYSYLTNSLIGAMKVHPQISVAIQFPITAVFLKNSVLQTQKKVGIGDLMTTVNWKYNLEREKLTHSFGVSGGIKFPTGKYEQYIEEDGFTILPSLGTGSFDIPITVSYTILLERYGFFSQIFAKFNTKNKHELHYGNQYICRFGSYYRFYLKKAIVKPNIGIETRVQQKNVVHHIIRKFSGMKSMGVFGAITLNVGNFELIPKVGIPFWNKVEGNKIAPKPQVSFTLNYLISKKEKI